MSYTALSRPLVYPLKNPLVIEAITEDDGEGPLSSFVWPEDSDERVIVPFLLSLNEYNVLANSIEAGRDIAYGEDSIQVLWLWLRNMRIEVSLCDAIAACIAGSEGTQAALRAFVTSDPAIDQWATNKAEIAVLDAIKRGENLLLPDQCDPDVLFSSASEFVFIMNTTATDLFEALEAVTNIFERAQLVTTLIPTTQFVMAINAISGFADQLAEEVGEDYASTYNSNVYDKIRCEIFCLIKDACELSIDDLFSFYKSKTSELVPNDPAEAIAFMTEYLVTASFPSDTIVYAVHLFILSLVRGGQNIMNMDFAKVGLRLQAAGEEPDPDWETLCEECDDGCSGTWGHPMEFYQGDVESVVENNYIVGLVGDSVPGFRVIRTSEYGDWSKGYFEMTAAELIGSTPYQLYAEDENGGVVYDGQDIDAFKATLPKCMRYFQAVKREDTMEFSLDLTIVTE